jgi:hypothetical protein
MVLALALGVIAGFWDHRVFMRVLVIGFVPVIWGVSRVLERIKGHAIWRIRAPYPYRWMPVHAENASRRPAAATPAERALEQENRLARRLAA